MPPEAICLYISFRPLTSNLFKHSITCPHQASNGLEITLSQSSTKRQNFSKQLKYSGLFKSLTKRLFMSREHMCFSNMNFDYKIYINSNHYNLICISSHIKSYQEKSESMPCLYWSESF